MRQLRLLLSDLHKRLWPIYPQDRIKFIPLLVMKLLLALNYTLLYNSKDTLVVSEGIGSGAEAIPLLKGFFVIACAFLVMLIYNKASNHLSRANLFYLTLSPFLIFFLLFNFVIFPNKEFLTPNHSADLLLSYLGESRSHWVAIYRNWYNSLFYVIAEMWGVVTINLLFWTFANQISSIKEAKRFYTLYSAAGDLGAMLSAYVINICFVPENFSATLFSILNWTVALGVITLAIYYMMDRHILPNRKELNWIHQRVESKKKKEKPSLITSLKTLARSPSLSCITMMVIGYALTLNLIEVFWKAILKMALPSSSEYLSFMNQFSYYTGLSSLLVTVFAAGQILRNRGWHFTAQITPILVGGSGIAFFLLYYTQNYWAAFAVLSGFTPTLVLAYFGALQNILSKTCKYSFFDPTKEMAYIPLDEEEKTKGKAAVDVVGSRLGKSGSSWLQNGLMELFRTNSIFTLAPLICPLIIVMSGVWSWNCSQLKRIIYAKKEPKDLTKEDPLNSQVL